MNTLCKFSVVFVLVYLCCAEGAKSSVCYNPGPDDPLPAGGLLWLNCTKPHEQYACGGACQNECNTLGDVCPIVNIRCNDACYCCQGYARDCKGNCIPEKNCPPKGSCKRY